MKTVNSYIIKPLVVYLVWKTTLPYTRAFWFGVKEGWKFQSEYDREPNEEERKRMLLQYHFSEQLRKI